MATLDPPDTRTPEQIKAEVKAAVEKQSTAQSVAGELYDEAHEHNMQVPVDTSVD
ncbi:MAG: hypothetical protein Q9165_001133 [Trypethelium subeluteriae]